MTTIAELALNIKTTGARQATRELDDLGKQAGRTERAAASVVKSVRDVGPALLAGFTIAGAGLTRYVMNTIEAEKAQAQLEARIKSTRMAAGLSASQLNGLADALQRVTTFDDDSITNAQSLLLTFTQIGRTTFPRATEAILDLATAMNTDLKSATIQVGKALNDPIRVVTALSEAGVQFNDTQRDLIKSLVETGKVAEAQSIILAELETQFGGAAKAARNTFGGALQSLRNTIDNLLEGDGNGGLRGARDAVEQLNASLNDPGVKRGVDSVAEGFFDIANAAIKATAEVGNYIGRYREFLANSGFTKVDGDSTPAQIEARQQALRGVLERVESGRTIFGPDTARKIRQELNAIAAQVEQESPLSKALGLGNLIGGQKFSAVPFSAVDYSVAGAARAGRGDDEETRATGRALLAKVTRELTEEEKRLAEIAEVNALIDGEAADATRELFFAQQASAEAAADALQRNEDFIAVMREDLRLMGLSNEERAKAIALRGLEANATDAQRAAVEALAVEQERALERTQMLDGLRGSLEDTFTSIVTGAKSAKDAFKDLFDEIAAQITRSIIKNAIENLLGPQGSSGGGSFGNSFGSILQGLFGGGRAIGGPVSAGRLYEVGEKGRPEILSVGDSRYLLPPRGGKVSADVPPPRKGDFSQQVNITIAERTTRQTLQQIEFATHRAGRRAHSRNR